MKIQLGDVPIFSGLNDRAIEAFLEQAKEFTVAAGDIIAREGETNDCMFLIQAGEVSVMKNYDTATPVTLAVLGPGECFGEMCIIDTQPRSATGKAVTATTVVSIGAAAFVRLYQRAPDQYCLVLLNIARDLSKRLRHLGDAFAARL